METYYGNRYETPTETARRRYAQATKLLSRRLVSEESSLANSASSAETLATLLRDSEDRLKSSLDALHAMSCNAVIDGREAKRNLAKTLDAAHEACNLTSVFLVSLGAQLEKAVRDGNNWVVPLNWEGVVATTRVLLDGYETDGIRSVPWGLFPECRSLPGSATFGPPTMLAHVSTGALEVHSVGSVGDGEIKIKFVTDVHRSEYPRKVSPMYLGWFHADGDAGRTAMDPRLMESGRLTVTAPSFWCDVSGGVMRGHDQDSLFVRCCKNWDAADDVDEVPNAVYIHFRGVALTHTVDPYGGEHQCSGRGGRVGRLHPNEWGVSMCAWDPHHVCELGCQYHKGTFSRVRRMSTKAELCTVPGSLSIGPAPHSAWDP